MYVYRTDGYVSSTGGSSGSFSIETLLPATKQIRKGDCSFVLATMSGGNAKPVAVKTDYYSKGSTELARDTALTLSRLEAVSLRSDGICETLSDLRHTDFMTISLFSRDGGSPKIPRDL